MRCKTLNGVPRGRKKGWGATIKMCTPLHRLSSKSGQHRAVGSALVRDNHAVLALQSLRLQILKPYRLAARHLVSDP